jgi:CheY-like chemotaxis protein
MPSLIQRRGMAAIGAMLLLLGLAVAATAFLVSKQKNDQAWVEHTLEVQLHLGRVASLMQDAEAAKRGFLITENTRFLDEFRRVLARLPRLLAFSRQQPLVPVITDPNALIAGMADLLRRTLGENVSLETVQGGGLWRTMVDFGQLEHAILNLVLNARDAMDVGGRLTIETFNAALDDAYSVSHVDVSAGQYVVIAVSDNGKGMTADVAAKAFDPFFTTKGVGKGTGLGLSQVFGFVKQSGGHVKIYSEAELGTTVKIYLPRHVGDEPPVSVADHRTSEVPVARPGEIVLVVEDEDKVRRMAVDVLRDLGYTVAHASGGVQGLQKIETIAGIKLLLTDIVMPDMNGRQLAEAARKRLPEIKVLYTTGYTRNAVIHDGKLDPDVNFLAKPFTVGQLVKKVRAVIDER